jgi:protein arginine kinase activator
MKCQRCKEREANVKIMKQTTGKAPQMLMLCDECARELGIAMPGNLMGGGIFGSGLGGALGAMTNPLDMLASAFEAPFGLGLEGLETTDEGASCPTCGITQSQFTKSGFLGCPDCYKVFAESIDPMFLRTQMGSKHVGRKPGVSDEIDVPANIEVPGKDETAAPVFTQVETKADEQPDEEKAKSLLILEKERLLKQAVKEENYLEAAKIRDEIQALKGEEEQK